MSTKRAFILGAGFSKQAGLPLATELTTLILDKFREYELDEMLAWFDWLEKRINWLEKASSGTSVSINIEQVFDLAHFDAKALYMKQHRCSIGRSAGDTPWNDAESIETWLSYMEHDLGDIIWEEQKKAEGGLGNISRFSEHLKADDVILTFNYDTLMENSFSKLNTDWCYGFEQENSTGIQILKMHGSINWLVVPRNKYINFGYPMLFKKQDANRSESDWPSNEEEWDYVLIKVPDPYVGSRIENRALQSSEKPYLVGIGGLGRYKPLEKLPGMGEVWSNAMRFLRHAEEVYIVGFSLSPFDAMARLHLGGVMCNRYEKKDLPKMITLIDPRASKLKDNFLSVFGAETPMEIYEQEAQEVDWSSLLGG